MKSLKEWIGKKVFITYCFGSDENGMLYCIVFKGTVSAVEGDLVFLEKIPGCRDNDSCDQVINTKSPGFLRFETL